MRPKGLAKTGGRKQGSTNKVTQTAKVIISEQVDDNFVKNIFSTIEQVESPTERVRLKIKILEFIVPKPREQEDLKKEDEFRKTFMDKMFPKRD